MVGPAGGLDGVDVPRRTKGLGGGKAKDAQDSHSVGSVVADMGSRFRCSKKQIYTIWSRTWADAKKLYMKTNMKIK